MQALVQFAIDTYGKLDIVISNAAVNPASGPILAMEDSAIEKVSSCLPLGSGVGGWGGHRGPPIIPCCPKKTKRLLTWGLLPPQVLAINVKSAILLAKLAVPHMRPGGSATASW